MRECVKPFFSPLLLIFFSKFEDVGKKVHIQFLENIVSEKNPLNYALSSLLLPMNYLFIRGDKSYFFLIYIYALK